MNERSLRTLEYDKALGLLKKYTQSNIANLFVDELKPSSDLQTVIETLSETKDAIALVIRKGNPSLSGIMDISSMTSRLKIGANLNNKELLSLRDNLYVSDRLKRYLKESNSDLENESILIKNKLLSLYTNKTLEKEIQRCIISEDEMADDASPALHSLRRKILAKQDQVRNRLNNYIKSAKYSKYIQDNVITIRGNRYVIPVKQEFRNNIKGVLHDSSASGATLYIEPMDVVNLNNEIRELGIEEKREVERILKLLSDIAREYTSEFDLNLNLLVFADITFAKASMALNDKYMIPDIDSKKNIRIVKGRHPLIDPKIVVPIDFHIGDSFNTLVITGPNTGGKTVSLKTVGLLTLMTQSGLPIPASEGTVMAVFQSVYADIGDEQSIEQSLSTFSSHMTNIISILRDCDDESLVLFDELGAGTDPTEGSALALAILERLMYLKCTTIATTHYQQIKMYASVTDGIENASCEFDVKTLRPTFRLLIGVPGKSNALYISRRLGLDHRVIENAGKFIDGDNLDYEDVILSLEKSRQRIEKEKVKAIKSTRETNVIKEQLDRRLRQVDGERNKIINDARKEAKQIIDDSRHRADEFLNELNNLKKSGKIKGSAKIEAAFRTKYKQVLEESPQVKPVNTSETYKISSHKDIKPGDDIRIMDLNQKATVLEVADKNGDVLVQAGIMKLRVPISNLELVKAKVKPQVRVNTYNVSKATKLELEIDIRGFASDEIDMKVSKFLDNASMMSLEEVQIIHGKGTGILRKAVHNILRENPHAESFRLGKYGEGETGVTVVKLK
ncbi:MAG: endonuclease MutS2 [Clostridiales bacterium]|nr:endonuclease MutS2 [Clostridiales bacterium]